MAAEAERVYRAYNAAENAHDLAATTALVTSDLEVAINGRERLASGEEDAAANSRLFEVYPDYRREIVEIVSDGEHAAVRWRMLGQPVAGSDLPPLDVHGCSFVEARDGRLSRAFLYVDEIALAAVLPPAGGRT